MERLTGRVAELFPPVQVGRRHLMAVVVLQRQEPRVVEADLVARRRARRSRSGRYRGGTSRRRRRRRRTGSMSPAAAPLVTTRSTPTRSPAGTSDNVTRVGTDGGHGRVEPDPSGTDGRRRIGALVAVDVPEVVDVGRVGDPRTRRDRPERPTVERRVLPPAAWRESDRRHLGQERLVARRPTRRTGRHCRRVRVRRRSPATRRAARATRASPHPGSSESNWGNPAPSGHRRPRPPTCSPSPPIVWYAPPLAP